MTEYNMRCFFNKEDVTIYYFFGDYETMFEKKYGIHYGINDGLNPYSELHLKYNCVESFYRIAISDTPHNLLFRNGSLIGAFSKFPSMFIVADAEQNAYSYSFYSNIFGDSKQIFNLEYSDFVHEDNRNEGPVPEEWILGMIQGEFTHKKSTVFGNYYYTELLNSNSTMQSFKIIAGVITLKNGFFSPFAFYLAHHESIDDVPLDQLLSDENIMDFPIDQSLIPSGAKILELENSQELNNYEAYRSALVDDRIDKMVEYRLQVDAPLRAVNVEQDKWKFLNHIVKVNEEIIFLPGGTYTCFSPSNYDMRLEVNIVQLRQVKNHPQFLVGESASGVALGQFLRDRAQMPAENDVLYYGAISGTYIAVMHLTVSMPSERVQSLYAASEKPVLFYKTQTEFILVPHWKAAGVSCQIPFLSPATLSKCVRLPLSCSDQELAEGLERAWEHCGDDWVGELSIDAIGPLPMS